MIDVNNSLNFITIITILFQMLWDYKRTVSQDPKLEYAVEKFCKDDLEHVSYFNLMIYNQFKEYHVSCDLVCMYQAAKILGTTVSEKNNNKLKMLNYKTNT